MIGECGFLSFPTALPFGFPGRSFVVGQVQRLHLVHRRQGVGDLFRGHRLGVIYNSLAEWLDFDFRAIRPIGRHVKFQSPSPHGCPHIGHDGPPDSHLRKVQRNGRSQRILHRSDDLSHQSLKIIDRHRVPRRDVSRVSLRLALEAFERRLRFAGQEGAGFAFCQVLEELNGLGSRARFQGCDGSKLA
jgi:hypothetical protein